MVFALNSRSSFLVSCARAQAERRTASSINKVAPSLFFETKVQSRVTEILFATMNMVQIQKLENIAFYLPKILNVCSAKN